MWYNNTVTLWLLCIYTRSPKHFTPQGAGNKSRSDLNFSKFRFGLFPCVDARHAVALPDQYRRASFRALLLSVVGFLLLFASPATRPSRLPRAESNVFKLPRENDQGTVLHNVGRLANRCRIPRANVVWGRERGVDPA